MKKLLIISTIVGAVIYNTMSTDAVSSSKDPSEGWCEQGGVYSKQFNCEYVYNKATYNVYYWRYLDNDKSEKLVGTTIGLTACRDTAIYAHRNANEKTEKDLAWNERMYICMLTKDGQNLEKHRL